MNFFNWIKGLFNRNGKYISIGGSKEEDTQEIPKINRNESSNYFSYQTEQEYQSPITQDVIIKVIDMVKNDLAKPYIRKQNSDGSMQMLELNYDENLQCYSAIIRYVINGRWSEQEEKYDLSLEEFIPFLRLPEFEEKILELYNTRIEKEAQHKEAKQFLLFEVEKAEMNDNQRRAMINIIDRITPLTERVGYKNKVPLDYRPDVDTEITLSEYFHADSDGTRRLLKVKESFKSPRYNKYTHFSVAEFMKYVKEENINLEEFDQENETVKELE